MPPEAVMLVASNDAKRNLSDEAWMAWTEPPIAVSVSLFGGKYSNMLAGDGNHITLTTVDSVADGGGAGVNGGPGDEQSRIVKKPNPRVKRKHNATVLERLDEEEYTVMLGAGADWELAVPNGDGTDVLTKDALREATETKRATGTVTLALTQITQGDKAVLDDALEANRPKSSAARYATALGVPLSSIALLATAAGGLVGWTTDVALARPWLLAVAGFFGLAALAVSLLSTIALREDEVYLSRIDLLRARTRPPGWIPLFGGLLFLIAIGCAVAGVFPVRSDSDVKASFGKHSSVQAGTLTRVGFTVSYTNLPADVKDVLVSISVPDKEPQSASMPRQSDGTAGQRYAAVVDAPVKLTVTAQPRDHAGNAVGTPATHEYQVNKLTSSPAP